MIYLLTDITLGATATNTSITITNANENQRVAENASEVSVGGGTRSHKDLTRRTPVKHESENKSAL
jgi:hypothetical protein